MDFSFGSQDMSRSMDQLCAHLTMSNLAVPKIDAYDSIFEFISEFEKVTEVLPDNQKGKMLARAFPIGRYTSWYTANIKPILITASWETIKNKLIERYSDVEDKDRHLKRVDTLKFDPNGKGKLYDFVEEFLISLSKALPHEDEETKIRYIKARLPAAILPTLSSISHYVSAKTLDEYLKAFREYDRLKSSNNVINTREDISGEKIKFSELITILKDISDGIKKQTSANVAALAPRSLSPDNRQSKAYNEQSNLQRSRSPVQNRYQVNRNRSPSTYQERYNRRSPSPVRESGNPNYYNSRNNCNNQEHNQQNPNYSNYQFNNPPINSQNQSYLRGRSPPPRYNYRYRNHMEKNTNNSSPIRQPLASSSRSNDIYNEAYYQRFGVPTSPCQYCRLNHWSRHCPDHLN